jgi:hypothetical protein
MSKRINSRRVKRIPLAIETLENRLLFSVIAACLGQDGHDYVGTAIQSAPQPNDYQDIHVSLSGLSESPANIKSIVIGRHGGDAWGWTPTLSQAADLISSGSSTGDLYLEPFNNDPSTAYFDNITIVYNDLSTESAYNVTFGHAINSNLRVAGKSLAVSYTGQTGADYTGAAASPGPDGVQDVQLDVSNLSADVPTSYTLVDNQAGTPDISWTDGNSGSLQWPSGVTPTSVSNALATNRTTSGGMDSANLYVKPVTNQTTDLFHQYASATTPAVGVVVNNPQNMTGGQWVGGPLTYPVGGSSPIEDGNPQTSWNSGTFGSTAMANIAFTSGSFDATGSTFTNTPFSAIGDIRIWAAQNGTWNPDPGQIQIAYTTSSFNPGNAYTYNSGTLGVLPSTWNTTALVTEVNGSAPNSETYGSGTGWTNLSGAFTQGNVAIGGGLTSKYVDLAVNIPAGATSIAVSFGNVPGGTGGLLIQDVQAFAPNPDLFHQYTPATTPAVGIIVNNPQDMGGGQWVGGSTSNYPIGGSGPIDDGNPQTTWNSGTFSSTNMANIAFTQGSYNSGATAFTNAPFGAIADIRIWAAQSGSWYLDPAQIQIAYTTSSFNPGNGYTYNSGTLGIMPSTWNTVAPITAVNGVASTTISYGSGTGWTSLSGAFTQGSVTIPGGLTSKYVDLAVAIPAGATSIGISFGNVPTSTGGLLIQDVQAFAPAPAANLTSGAPLTLQVAYQDSNHGGKTDTATLVAGAVNPALTTSAAALPVLSSFTAHSTAQDTSYPGNSHITVDTFPTGQSKTTVAQAILSDEAGGIWVYSATGTFPYTDGYYYFTPQGAGNLGAGLTMTYNSATGAFAFPPYRNESGANLTLRLVFNDGSQSVAQFAGATSNVNLRAPAAGSNNSTVTTVAQLTSALANSSVGSIYLANSLTLSEPITINYPVSITAAGGVTLTFAPSATDPGWAINNSSLGAITVASSNVSLNGFSIAFSGDSSNWTPSGGTVNSQKPVIAINGSNLVDLSFSYLNITVPSAATSSEQAIFLFNHNGNNDSGSITHGTFNGGTISLQGGPWQLLNNDYQGSPTNTYVYAVIDFNNEHDLLVQYDHFHAVTSGQIYRLFVSGGSAVGRGFNDSFLNDTVDGGIGRRDSTNNPELFLEEQYTPHFEGTPSAISANGYVLEIPYMEGLASTTGDVVSILSGPNAGQWDQIAQAIGPDTFLMDTPLPAGAYTIAIARGWVNDAYQNNTLDLRPVSNPSDAVLDLFDQYGVNVSNNFLAGGTVVVAAVPNEDPAPFLYGDPAQSAGDTMIPPWGWSYLPTFGAVVTGNTLKDASLFMGVEHSTGGYIAPDNGALFFSGSLTNNIFQWTTPTQPAYSIGQSGMTHQNTPWLDDKDTLIVLSGNYGSGPSGAAPVIQVFASSLESASGSPWEPVDEGLFTLPLSSGGNDWLYEKLI